MDVYSVFSSSSARRDSTRLDLDLQSIHRESLTAGSAAPIESTPGRKLPHVGIVGAGIAGLRCADILLQHGFQVTVLEGRRRLGGRLHQARLCAVDSPLEEAHGDALPLVDMGPNWIHGTKDNPILDLVHATETVTSGHDVDEQGNHLTGAVFDQDGKLLPLDEGEALSTLMWKIVEEAFVHSNSNCSTIDAGESLRDFFLQRLEAHVPRSGSDPAKVSAQKRQEMVMQFAEFWGAFVGSPVSRQSLKYYWLEECIEGENLFCAGTYKKVLDRLVEPVAKGASIHLGQTVTRIETGKSDASNRSNTTTTGVRVTTSAGASHVFDEVVCTAPLGWLKKNAAATFHPPFPERLLQAIDNIGYGCLEKVYISFPEPFWQHPNPETGRVVRGFCQWLAPGVYAQPSNPEHLSQEAVDLSSLPASTAHPTLLFYIFGRQSEIITDTLASLRERPVENGQGEFSETTSPNSNQAAFLVDYFKPYFATLPHYDAASPACRPTACLATNWLHDDLAGNGSYSNFQVGLTAGDEDIRIMREGLPKRRLWLAGEHTAPFVALGTATGAYWSGESVGRRLIETYRQRRASISKQATETAEGMPESSIRDAALVSS